MKFAIPSLLLSIIFLFPVGSNAGGRRPPWESMPLNTVVDGVVRKGYNVLEIDGHKMVSIRTINKLFGGQIQWKRVSRKVVFIYDNKFAEFELDSSTAVVAGKFVKLSPQVRAWGNDVFIPASIFLNTAFQRMVSSNILWDPGRSNLTIDPIPDVGSPRLYSYPLRSQISVELGTHVNYRVLSVRKNTLAIRLYGGRAREREKVAVEDGAVRSVEVAPRARTTDLIVVMSSSSASPSVTLEENPRTLFIDVEIDKQLTLSSGTAKASAGKDSPKSSKGKQNGAESGKKVAQAEKKKTNGVTTPIPGPVTKKISPSAVPVPANEDDFGSDSELTDVGEMFVKGTNGKGKKGPDGALLALSPFRTIVIDPGHGGKDVGAVGPNGTLEKEVNLQIGLALAKLLKKEGRFNVILTRDKDVFVPLQERSSIANKAKADLFISLHCNAGIQRDSKGFEIFYLSENATDDEAAAVARRENAVIELEGVVGKARQELEGLLWSLARNEHMNDSAAIAGHISQQVVRRIKIHNRGVKQAGFYVLRGTSTPAILVESAFISHPKEEGMLRSSRFHRKLVDALYAGLLDFERKKIQTRLAQKPS